MQGSPARQFGRFEARQVTSTKTLWLALVAALASWGLSFVCPFLESSGETWAAIGAVLAVVLRIVLEWARDNTGNPNGQARNDTTNTD